MCEDLSIAAGTQIQVPVLHSGVGPNAVHPTEELHGWMSGVAWGSPVMVVGITSRGQTTQFKFPLRVHLSGGKEAPVEGVGGA